MQMMNEDSKTLRTLLWLGIPFLAILTLVLMLAAANRPPVVKLPPVKLPKPNGWDDLVQATTLLIPTGPYSDATRKPEDWTASELRKWVQTETPAFDAMREGLAKKCVHPPVRDFANSFDTYARLRELARCTAGRALYYKVIGKPGMAADSLVDGTETGVVIQRGAPLITGLVGNAIEMISICHLEPLLTRLSSDDLTRVATRMEKISAERVSYSDILVETSRTDASEWAKAFGSGNRLVNASDWNGQFTGCGVGSSSALARTRYSVSFAFANKTSMISENRYYMEALAREQRTPYTGTSRLAVPDNPLIALLGDTYLRGRRGFVRNETIFIILQTEIALLRYRADHGRYPSILAELSPTYLKSVLIDPFGLGKPLRYRPTNAGRSCLLYSLGSDLKDDRGKPVDPPDVANGSPGDIVAGKLSAKP